MFLKILIIFVIFSNVNVTSRKLSPRIINGYNAAEGQFPWHAVLFTQFKSDYGICGGSIISPIWILTAGHCLTGGPKYVTIKMGSIHMKKMTQTRISHVFFNHPKYDGDDEPYDIALVKADKPIQYTNTIRPVKLATRYMSEPFLNDRICRVCGFGFYKRKRWDPVKEFPTILKYTKLLIFPLKTCKHQYGYYSKDYDNTGICGRELNREQYVCTGDSGGGLIYYQKGIPYVVGVVSFGRASCKGAPTAYQSVQKHLDWISKKTGIKV